MTENNTAVAIEDVEKWIQLRFTVFRTTNGKISGMFAHQKVPRVLRAVVL